MVLMIRKNVAETCARIFTTGALFVCGAMITALNAYATDGGGQNGGSTGAATTGVSSYTTGEIEDTSNNEPREGIEIFKSLKLQNVVQGYIPSVPDVMFHYSVNYNNEFFAAGTTDYTPVAQITDANGTKADVWRGPKGSLTFGDKVDENGVSEFDLVFHHDDKADGDVPAQGTGKGKDDGQKDVMTKVIPISINGKSFKRPGVYRYALIESMQEVDFNETGTQNEQNVTGNKADGSNLDGVEADIELQPTLLGGKDADKTNISQLTNNQLKEKRFLDVYVEWKPQEDGLMVTDVVLHDITGDLVQSKLSEQDQAYSRPKIGDDGRFLRDEQTGYIVYDSEDPEDLYAETYDPASILSGSKKTGFAESIYTTYDLVIGKELMGKGLTNYDIEKRIYRFEVTFNAPAGTVIRRAMPARKSNGGPTFFAVADDGTQLKILDEASAKAIEPGKVSKLTEETYGSTVEKMIIEIKFGEYALISGLPSGATYMVKEVDNPNEEKGQPATLELFETYHADNMEDMILTGSVDAEYNAHSLGDHAKRNTTIMTKQGEYADTKKNGNGVITAAQEKEIGLALADDTELLTINKKAAADSVNNVFFLNLRYDNVVTGVAMSVAPYALMVLAAGVGIGVYAAAKRKSRDEEDDEMDEM